MGDDWSGAGPSLLLKRPSEIIEKTWNYLINAAHAQNVLQQRLPSPDPSTLQPIGSARI
ncbi:MAG: hypothetical protein ABIQ97_00260 [Lysobacteraceae bacterium]